MSRQFKGASASQDARYTDKEQKLLKTLTFPSIFKEKVDVKKINIQVLRPWIAKEISTYLGMEDDVVIEYVYSLLEEKSLSGIDPRGMQIKLTGFLENNTVKFMEDLWKLLVSAQNSIGGIPKEFLEAKKEEIRKKMEQDEILEREFSRNRSRNSGYQDRRQRSPSPRNRRRSRSPPRNRRRSPSPTDRRDRSHIDRRERSPIGRRERSPTARRERSPIARRERSPVERRDISPFQDSRRDPRGDYRRRSRSPQQRYRRSGDRRRDSDSEDNRQLYESDERRKDKL